MTEVPALDAGTRDAMFHLYHRYYEATSPARFESDLCAKDEALLLFDESQTLRGFSTLRRVECSHEGRDCRAIFSGDTIVHHRYWGEQSLAFNWIRRAGSIKAERPETPLYWLLIVKGHRTYRYLQAFSQTYFPHWRNDTPASLQQLMDRLGEQLFGTAYCSDRGIVRFPRSHGHLRPEWAEPPVEVLSRPEVQFFLRRNPGYRQGEELLCLTELCAANLRPLARRIFTSGVAG